MNMKKQDWTLTHLFWSKCGSPVRIFQWNCVKLGFNLALTDFFKGLWLKGVCAFHKLDVNNVSVVPAGFSNTSCATTTK